MLQNKDLVLISDVTVLRWSSADRFSKECLGPCERQCWRHACVAWNQSCPPRPALLAVAEHCVPLGDKLSVEQGYFWA